jgi:hypothetical protein
MHITYERDDERRRIIVTIAGPIAIEEVLAIVDRQAREGTWRYGMLYDSRRASTTGSPADVRVGLMHVDAMSRIHGERGPVAFVTTMPAAYAMTRLYSTLANQQHQPVEAFRDIGDAERWLALHTQPEPAPEGSPQ